MKIQESAARRTRGQQRLHEAVHLAATTGGINSLAATGLADAMDCVYCYNLFPSRYGLRSRPGYVKWGSQIPAGTGGIRTIIPYVAPAGPTGNRLFAVTSDGIYDITAGGTPSKKFNFADKSGMAGYCSWTAFSNIAGDYLLIADQRNGYLIYSASADTITAGTLTGADPATMAHVAVWKNRVWFTQRDSQRAWYLGTVGTITGAVTAFEFGAKFKYGGHLIGIWNWTTDGGAGIDDFLVAISSQGDLAVYTGWDPAVVTGEGAFTLKGVWYLGPVPAGRRMVLEDGGDLLILTAEGVLSLTQLVSGSGRGDDRAYYLTAKINPLLREAWRQRDGLTGWEINSLPRYSAVIMTQPRLSSDRPQQWMYSYETKGWFFIRDVPMQTVENWGARVFFGDASRQVWELTGLLDAVDPAVSTSGTPVEFSLLTSYQGLGDPARIKRVQSIRAHWTGEALPRFTVAARYDFQLTESGPPPPFSPVAGTTWGSGSWDGSTWAGGIQTLQQPYGAVGMGRYVAMAMRGVNRGDSAFIGADLLVDAGGWL